MPEGVELPGNAGSMTSSTDDGHESYAVLWDRRYVLIPPSTRSEGAYKAVGAVTGLPDWLRDRMVEHGRLRAERTARSRGAAAHDGPVAHWGASVTWAEILEDTDWTNTGKPDSCGCDIWTAPGLHSSPKSATAHEPGCAVFSDSPDPPLHIWTDHDVEPFTDCTRGAEGRTVTRLDAVAAIHYEKNVGDAMTALDLHDDEPQTLDAGMVGGAKTDDASKTKGESKLSGRALHDHLTLPDEYWEAHPALAHIRQAARATRNSPDGVLGSVHAEVSAALHPRCRVSTGVRKDSQLNAYVVLCDDQGGGKTSAQREAQSLLAVRATYADPNLDDDPTREYPLDRTVYRAGGFGSGEGIAAQYVEYLPVDPLKASGRKRNVQVRSNVLFTVDEGESVKVELVDKAGSKFGENFRKAWAGADLGEGNAHAETRRRVPEGQYVIGASIGMQTPTLRDLLNDRQHRFGTVPRLDCFWMPDPGAPDERPRHPGRLKVDLSRFDRSITFCDELLAELDAKAVAITRGMVAAGADRHRELSICRRAARLWVLCVGSGLGEPVDDPFTIPRAFYDLAEIEYERSARIKSHAESLTKAENKGNKQARIKAAADQELAVDEARRAARVSREERIAGRIVRFLTAHGPTRWTGKDGIWQRAKRHGDDREEWEQVRDGLVDDERVVLDDGSYALAEGTNGGGPSTG